MLYAEDFDEPLLPEASAEAAAAPAPSEPELIDPRFTLEELRAATEQAREDACQAERSAAATLLAAQRGAALATLAEQVSLMQADAAGRIEEALDALARTSLSLLSAALPALCAGHAQGELRALLQRVLPPLRQLPELQIRLHPSLREAVEDETGALLEGSGVRVTWTESAKLRPGDIAVSWQNATALRDTAAICAEIHQAMVALFGPGPEILPTEVAHGK